MSGNNLSAKHHLTHSNGEYNKKWRKGLFNTRANTSLKNIRDEGSNTHIFIQKKEKMDLKMIDQLEAQIQERIKQTNSINCTNPSMKSQKQK